MILLLFVVSFVLFVWGLIVLFTGGYVATLDIAANLIASAALVLSLAVLARVAERALAQFSGAAGAQDGARARPGFFKRVSVRAAPEREAPAPAQTPAAAAAPESDPSRTVIREGEVEGRHFRLYADGSIDAEGPTGMRRYRSVEELRADMLAAAEDTAPKAEHRAAAPEEAREPTARSPFAPRAAEPDFGAERYEERREAGLGGARLSDRLTSSREAASRETPARSSWSDRFRSTSLFDKDEADKGEDEEGDGGRR